MTTNAADGLAIRRGDERDSDALTTLAEAVWPLAYDYTDPAYAQDTIDRWWSHEANLRSIRDTTVLVALRDDDLVGMGNIDLRPEVPVVWKLAVHPSEQGRGTGRELLRRLLAVVGDGPVRLSYADGNDQAARFYRRFGFRQAGTTGPDRPDWPGEVVMEWRRGP